MQARLRPWFQVLLPNNDIIMPTWSVFEFQAPAVLEVLCLTSRDANVNTLHSPFDPLYNQWQCFKHTKSQYGEQLAYTDIMKCVKSFIWCRSPYSDSLARVKQISLPARPMARQEAATLPSPVCCVVIDFPTLSPTHWCLRVICDIGQKMLSLADSS